MSESPFFPLSLQNAIFLSSIFVFFAFQVDLFNLDKLFPSSNWKNDYGKNMKVMLLSILFRLQGKLCSLLHSIKSSLEAAAYNTCIISTL